MPQGGEITVETSNVRFEENYAPTHKEIVSGNYVMVSVRDTGTSMTDDVKKRLFQPFFTTKPYGTGLGLATCRTIVERSDGDIDVSTEIGKGTIFKIYFPRVEQPLDVVAEPIAFVSKLFRKINRPQFKQKPGGFARRKRFRIVAGSEARRPAVVTRVRSSRSVRSLKDKL